MAHHEGKLAKPYPGILGLGVAIIATITAITILVNVLSNNNSNTVGSGLGDNTGAPPASDTPSLSPTVRKVYEDTLDAPAKSKGWETFLVKNGIHVNLYPKGEIEVEFPNGQRGIKRPGKSLGGVKGSGYYKIRSTTEKVVPTLITFTPKEFCQND